MSGNNPYGVKLIMGFIYREEDVFLKTLQILKRKFGKTDLVSTSISFTYTDYYNEEMGEGLKRRFVSFQRLIKREKMVSVKLYTIRLEKLLSREKKRLINIDPGYITLAKLVLLTRKDYFHRIYLGKGTYAEVTLYYKNRQFSEFPTTYPDYRTKEYKDILLKIRQLYFNQIKDASRA